VISIQIQELSEKIGEGTTTIQEENSVINFFPQTSSVATRRFDLFSLGSLQTIPKRSTTTATAVVTTTTGRATANDV
jgi:hypothetical protein